MKKSWIESLSFGEIGVRAKKQTRTNTERRVMDMLFRIALKLSKLPRTRWGRPTKNHLRNLLFQEVESIILIHSNK